MANQFPWQRRPSSPWQRRPSSSSRRRRSAPGQSVSEWLREREEDEDFLKRMGWKSPSERSLLKAAPPPPSSAMREAMIQGPGWDSSYRFRADPRVELSDPNKGLTGTGRQPVDEPYMRGMGSFAEQVQAAPEAPLSVSREEQDFQDWFSGIAGMYGYAPDPDDPRHLYDYRAAFRAGVREPEIGADGLPHWPSAFKSEDHPNRVVGGFDTVTGERDESVPMARSIEELRSLGWDETGANQLGREHGLPLTDPEITPVSRAGRPSRRMADLSVRDRPVEELRRLRTEDAARFGTGVVGQRWKEKLEQRERVLGQQGTPDVVDPRGPRWAADEDEFVADLHQVGENLEGVFGRELIEHVPVLESVIDPDRTYNIPTMWNGRQIENPDDKRQIAARRLASGEQPMYPNYATAEEANEAAARRSRRIGELRETVQEGLAPPTLFTQTEKGLRTAGKLVGPGSIRTLTQIISRDLDRFDWVDWDEDLRDWSTKTIDEQNEIIANLPQSQGSVDVFSGEGNFIPKAFKWMYTTLPEQLAAMSPILAAGYIGGAAATGAAAAFTAPVWLTAGVGAVAGSALMGLLYHSSDVQEQMHERDPNLVAPWTALAAAVPMAFLDSIVPGRLMGRAVNAIGRPLGGSAATQAVARRINNRFFQKMDEAVKAAGGVQRGSWFSIARESGRNAMAEAFTEVAQEAISTATADLKTGHKTDWGEWSIERPFDFGETGFLSEVPEIMLTAAGVGGAITTTSEYVTQRLIGSPNESPLSLPSAVSLQEYLKNQASRLPLIGHRTQDGLPTDGLRTRFNLKDQSDPGLPTLYNFADSEGQSVTTPEDLVEWGESIRPELDKYEAGEVSKETLDSPLNAVLRGVGLVPLKNEKPIQKAERILATGRIVPQLYDANGAMSEESILNSDMDIVTMAREIKRSKTSAQKPFNLKANAETNRKRAAKLLSKFLQDRAASAQKLAEVTHRYHVKDAFLKGETVPEQILADYKTEIDDWTETRDTRAAARREVEKAAPVVEPKPPEDVESETPEDVEAAPDEVVVDETASPVRQGVSDAIVSIENDAAVSDEDTGKLVKQLNDILTRDVQAAEDAEIEGAASDTAIQRQYTHLAQAKNRIDKTIRSAQKRGATSQSIQALQKASNQIASTMAAKGYEVADLLGQRFNEGMRLDASFREDDTLEAGQEIITRIIEPQVIYQGKMIQAGKVEVSVGTKQVEGDTQFKSDQRRREARRQAAEDALKGEGAAVEVDTKGAAETETGDYPSSDRIVESYNKAIEKPDSADRKYAFKDAVGPTFTMGVENSIKRNRSPASNLAPIYKTLESGSYSMIDAGGGVYHAVPAPWLDFNIMTAGGGAMGESFTLVNFQPGENQRVVLEKPAEFVLDVGTDATLSLSGEAEVMFTLKKRGRIRFEGGDSVVDPYDWNQEFGPANSRIGPDGIERNLSTDPDAAQPVRTLAEDEVSKPVTKVEAKKPKKVAKKKATKKKVKKKKKVSDEQQQEIQESKTDATIERGDTGQPKLFEVEGPVEDALDNKQIQSILDLIAQRYKGSELFGKEKNPGNIRNELKGYSAEQLSRLINEEAKGRPGANFRQKIHHIAKMAPNDPRLPEALVFKPKPPVPQSARLQSWVDGFFNKIQPVVNFAVQSAGSSETARKRRLGESSKSDLPPDKIGFLRMALEMETNPTHQRALTNDLMDLQRKVYEKTYQRDAMLDEGIKGRDRTKWAEEILRLDEEIRSLNDIGSVFVHRPLLAGDSRWDHKIPAWSARVTELAGGASRSDSGSPYGFLLVDENGKLKSLKNQSKLFQALYETGSKDPNRRNIKPEERASIFFARVEFFQQWQANQSLITKTGRLVKAVEKTINQWSRGRLNKEALALQRKLHDGVPLFARWTGLRNQSALTLALDNTSSIPDHGVVTAKMVDSFVKELTDETGSFTSDEAQQLREYLLRVFMSIDSNIDFSDLRIQVRERIEENKTARGVYFPDLGLIQVKPGLVNTVAHEVGHYLMHKWSRELSGDANWETSTKLAVQEENLVYNSDQTPVASEPRVEWFNQFREFITDITERADTRRTQEQIQLQKNKNKQSVLENKKIEAFARFVDWFTEKTQADAAPGSTLGGAVGERTKVKTEFRDNFTEEDFTSFVNLIQSKQGLDRTDHNPFGTEYDRIDTPYNSSWLTKLPDAILAQAARMGAVILDKTESPRLKLKPTEKVPETLDDDAFNKAFLELLGQPHRNAWWDENKGAFLDTQQQKTYTELRDKMYGVQSGEYDKSRLTEDEASQYDELERMIAVSQGWTSSSMPSHPARVAYAISQHLPLIREKAEQMLPSVRNDITLSLGTTAPIEMVKRPDGSEGLLVSTRVPRGLALVTDLRRRNAATGLWETVDAEERDRIKDTRLDAVDIPLNMVERVVGTDAFRATHPDAREKGATGIMYPPSPLLTMKEIDDYAQGKFNGKTFDQTELDHKITERVMEVGKGNLRYLLKAYDADLSKEAMKWYEGANNIALRLAEIINPGASRENLNRDQAAAILASLSPQAEWNQNIARAFRLVQIYNHFQSNPDAVFSEEMFKWWVRSALGKEKANYKKAIKDIKARKLSPADLGDIQKMDISKKQKLARIKKAQNAIEKQKVTDIEVAKKLLRDNLPKLENRSRHDGFNATFRETFTGDDVDVIAKYEGSFTPKSWRQMTGRPGVAEKARMIRAYEETQYEDDLGAQNPALKGQVLPKKSRKYVVYQPDGVTGGVLALNEKSGNPASMTWGSWPEIESALSILMDGSASNISEQLGLGHKVRSFFNNINVPSDERSVTIDTHAVAAFYFSPYGSNDPEVVGAFGGPDTVSTGHTGMNPMIAEAYFQLAEELGVSPRALQSVAWEAMRGLIPSTQKQSRMVTPKKARDAAAKAGTAVPRGIKTTKGEIPPEGTVWDDYQQGKISIEQVRAEIHQRSIDEGLAKAEESDGQASYHNGFRDPDWADESFRLSNDQSRVSEGVSTGQPTRLSPEYRSDTGGSALVGRRVTADVGRVLSDDELRLGEEQDRPWVWEPRRDYHTQFIREAQLFINTFRASADASEGVAPPYYSEVAEAIRRGYRQRGVQKQKNPALQTPGVIRGWISGIDQNKGELDFLGLDDWLQNDAPRYNADGTRMSAEAPLTGKQKAFSKVSVEDVLSFIGHKQLEIVEFINQPLDHLQNEGDIGATGTPFPVAVRQWPVSEMPTEAWRERVRDRGEVADHRIKLFQFPKHTEHSASGGYNHRTLVLVARPPQAEMSMDERSESGAQFLDEVAEHEMYDTDAHRDRLWWLRTQEHVPMRDNENFASLFTRGDRLEITKVLQNFRERGLQQSPANEKFYWGGDGSIDLTQDKDDIAGLTSGKEYDELIVSPTFDSAADARAWLNEQIGAATQVTPLKNVVAHVRVQDRVYPTYSQKQVEALWQKLRDGIYAQGFFSKTVKELQKARAEYDQLHYEDRRGDIPKETMDRLSRRRLGLLSELGSKEAYDTTPPNATWMPGRYTQHFDPYRYLFHLPGQLSWRDDVSFSLTDAVDRGILTDREVTMLMHESDLRSGRALSKHSVVLSEKARSYELETRQLWVDEVQSDWGQSETAVLDAIAEGYASKLMYTLEERAHWKRQRTKLREELDFANALLARSYDRDRVSPKQRAEFVAEQELIVRDLKESLKIIDESIKAVGKGYIRNPQGHLVQWDGPGNYDIPDDAKRQIERNLKKRKRNPKIRLAEGLDRSLAYSSEEYDELPSGMGNQFRMTQTGWQQPSNVDIGVYRKAPFPRLNWKLDSLKRVMRLAIEGGYDSVGLTDAATQRRRWDRTGLRLVKAEVVSPKALPKRPITETRGRKQVGIEDFVPSGLLNVRLVVESRSIDSVTSETSAAKDTYLVKVNEFGRIVSLESVEEPSTYLPPDIVGKMFDSVVQSRDSDVSMLKALKKAPKTHADQRTYTPSETVVVEGAAYESVYGERTETSLNKFLKPWNIRMRPVSLGLRVKAGGLEKSGGTVTGTSLQISEAMRQDFTYKGIGVWEKEVLNEAQLNEKFPNLSGEEQIEAAEEAGYDVIRDDPMEGKVPPAPKGQTPAKEPAFGTKEEQLLPISTIIERVSKGLGNLQVSIGRTRGFRGLYKPRLGSIWMKAANDLEVLSHEVGHHLYENLFKVKGKRFAQEAWTSELIELSGARPNLVSENASTTRRVREGAAEFFRIWSHDPRRAKVAAPEFYAEFERRISGDLEQTLRDFQKEYIKHFEANPADRFAAHLNFYTGRAVDLSEPDRFLRFEVNWLNEQAPIKKFVRELVRLQRSGKKRSAIADIFDVNDMPDFILDDAFRLAEMSKGATIKARSFLRIGVRKRDFETEQPIRNEKGNVRTKAFHGGLREAMEPVVSEWKSKGGSLLKLGLGAAGKKRDYFRAFSIYLAARRTKTLIERGADVTSDSTAFGRGGPTLEEAQAFIDQWETPGFKAAAENLYDFQSSLLDYAVDSGALSLEDVNRVRAVSTDYVPFNRVKAASEIILDSRGNKKALANTQDILKKFKGSGREIVDPIESIVKNTMQIVQQVESNAALLALVRQLRGFSSKEMESIAQFIEPVPARMEKVVSKKNVKDILKILSDQGIAFKDGQKWEKGGVEVPDSVINDTEILIQSFRPITTTTPYGNEISVLEDGERKYYRVNDKQLFDALSTVTLTPNQVPVIAWMGTGTQMLRQAATTTLEFLLRNPIRDTLQAATASKNIFIPGWTTARGLFSILAATDTGRALNKKLGRDADTWYDEFQNSLAGGYTLGSLNRDVIMEEVYALTPVKRRAFLSRIVRDPLTALRRFQEMMENSSRVGDFALSVRRLERKGLSPEESRAQAAYDAAEVTVNFKRMGIYGRNMNQTKAFFNASIQGKARLAEVFKRNPVKSTMSALLTITPLSMASWYLTKDDEEYDELLDWQKKGFWWFPLGKEKGHEWFVIPKPWELAHFFGNIPEAALNYVYKGEDGERLIKEIFPDEDSVWSLLGQGIPTFILPMIEVGFNRSLFRQGPIVSPFDWNVISPEHQSNRYTSETARQLAKLMDWKFFGAAHIDHLLQGYTAGLGGYGTDTTDALLRKEKLTIPKTDVGFDNPIAALMAGELERPPVPVKGTPKTRLWGSRALFRPSVAGGGAQSLRDFYEEANALAGVKRDMTIELKRGDTDAWRTLFDEHRDLLVREGRISSTRELLSFYRGMINRLYEQFDGETAQERGAKEQEYWNRMVDTARRHFGKSTLYRD
jgi:hypothetical protein